MGKKTKIDWCDATWNPVTGCLHGCEYCYARRIAERFGNHQMPIFTDYPVLDEPVRCTYTYGYMRVLGINEGKIQPYPFDFTPTFHRYRLDEPQKWTKPRTIFVCSMADLFGEWVPWEWILAVLTACEAAPQHRYIFLTKNPKRIQTMYNKTRIDEYNALQPDDPYPKTDEYRNVVPLPDHDNWWWGSTVTDSRGLRLNLGIRHNTFISVEPLAGPLDAGLGSFGSARWIIIGAETGNRKGKVIPKKEWIDNITGAAGITRAAVFMKESLRELAGDDFRQEYPWETGRPG